MPLVKPMTIGRGMNLTAVPSPVSASGGVGELSHLREGVCEGNADAALAASIFHDGQHTVGEAKKYLRQHGVLVRGGDA